MTIILLFKDWELQINGVSSYDSGEYHCQATTHPPSFISVILTVVGKYQIKCGDVFNPNLGKLSY